MRKPWPIAAGMLAFAISLMATDPKAEGDVDQSDFGILQKCFSAAGVAASPSCAN